MAKALDPADVADLTLVELSGEKLTNVLVPRIRLEISLSMAPVDEDPHRSRVSATARTFGVAEGAPEDDTTTPLYEGVVAYVIRFVDNGPDDEWVEGPPVVNFVWPYLRAGLIEQASRLGTLPLQLPIEIDATELRSTKAADDEADSVV